MKRIDIPYLIVGAGPVGMLGGILLGQRDRGALIVERRPGPLRAPAAHVVNARSFEICRQAGVDMNAIARASKDPVDAGHSVFMTTLAGEELGRLPFEQQGDDCLRHTPTPLRNLAQHRLEPILADTIEKQRTSELRYGQQWESSTQDADGVTSQVRDLANEELYEVRSRYVIAADGAGSRVRKSLGIEMDGPPRLQCFLMIHFEANLRELVKDRPGVLYWIMDPEVGGTFVAHDIDREWVYMHAYDPDQESEADFDDERCRALVLRGIGQDAPLKILHRGTWVMSAQISQAMRSERIFLAGDAAHRFPPTGGLGLNTGMQDVHGLVWKLCAVEDGWAPASILDSYESERRPVAKNNADQSLRNAMKLIEVPHALGTDEEPTTARMQATLADPTGRSATQAAVANQAEHFDMLGLQLGYVYAEGALVHDDSAAPHVDNAVREYKASSRAGARLPHAWLDAEGERVSTLDLVRSDAFTLFSWGEPETWAAALATIDTPPCVHVDIGETIRDPDGHWADVCGIEPGGAILVRPDQHVAWRSAGLPDDAGDALRIAFISILGTNL